MVLVRPVNTHLSYVGFVLIVCSKRPHHQSRRVCDFLFFSSPCSVSSPHTVTIQVVRQGRKCTTSEDHRSEVWSHTWRTLTVTHWGEGKRAQVSKGTRMRSSGRSYTHWDLWKYTSGRDQVWNVDSVFWLKFSCCWSWLFLHQPSSLSYGVLLIVRLALE